MEADGEDTDQHHFFSKCKYIRTCMKTLKQRIEESKDSDSHDGSFFSFLRKILTWEPDKRLTPQ